MMRFDRFTERAQDAAMRAYEILQRYSHNQVDTEHLFLALLEQPEGVVPQILTKLDVDVEQLKERLDQVLKSSPKDGSVMVPVALGHVFITPRVKHVLDIAQDEARRLKDEYVSTEHIFLGIASEKNSPTAALLADYGMTKEQDGRCVERGARRSAISQTRTRRVAIGLSKNTAGT